MKFPVHHRLASVLIGAATLLSIAATARAQANLQKLQTLCSGKACPQAVQLSQAISRGPTVASAKAPDVPKKN